MFYLYLRKRYVNNAYGKITGLFSVYGLEWPELLSKYILWWRLANKQNVSYL